jgi:glucose-1-phosphate cytidylyltransferase
MKIIILAGGWGSRLGKLSQTIPKPMVTVGGKPVLWHIMKIYSHYHISDFIIALGVKGDVIKEYFLNYHHINNDFTIDLNNNNIKYHNLSNSNWTVSLIDTGLNTLKGGRLKMVESYLDSEINMITYGDGLADIDINKLLAFHKEHKKTVTITGVHPPARFGELIENNGSVVTFEEKPQSSVGLINGGFMVFNKNMFDYLTTDEDCDFEFGALEKLAAKGEIMVYRHDGKWECMDNERDVEHLNHLWETNKAFWKVWK